MTTQPNVAELVTDVLVDTLGLDPVEIVPAADLEHDLGLDSLDRLELVTAIESRTGAAVPDAELKTIRTVGDAIALAERYQPVQAGA